MTLNNPNALANLRSFDGSFIGPGHPKGKMNITSYLKKMLRLKINNPKLLKPYMEMFPQHFPEQATKPGKTASALIALRLIMKALEGDTKAIEMIIDRTEVNQHLQELSANMSGRIVVEFINDNPLGSDTNSPLSADAIDVESMTLDATESINVT